jgi:uncharacterized membrane protein YdjX (TVP38/TMEM64 family)
MNKNKTLYLSLLTLIVAMMVGVLAMLMMAHWRNCSVSSVPGACLNLSADGAIQFIRSWGAWGVVGSMGLMVLHAFIPFPSEIITIANGMIYGKIWGIVITWTGAMLGAYAAFGLARLLARPFVQAILPAKQWDKLNVWTSKVTAVDLLLSRLLPLISFNLINYGSGLTPVSLWTFTWTTGLGMLPVTVLMVVLGDQANTLPWWVWFALVCGIIILWIVVRKLVYRSS